MGAARITVETVKEFTDVLLPLKAAVGAPRFS